MKVTRWTLACILLALISIGQSTSAKPLADETGAIELVSVASGGTIVYGNTCSTGFEGEFPRCMPSISADGRYVAFDSDGYELYEGGDIDHYMIHTFVHDRQTGITELDSVSSTGERGNDYSFWPVISADGNFVGFTSLATNLVSGDTNSAYDAFVHDRQTGATELVSVAMDGAPANSHSVVYSMSADGRFVAFVSSASNLVGGDTNGKPDVFVRDRWNGTTQRVSVASNGAQGRNQSGGGSLSADGRYVAFWSRANNLVSGDTNRGDDIFVHDLITGITERVSVASDGSQGSRDSTHTNQPFISADGQFVVFISDYRNLVSSGTKDTQNVFLRDRLTGTTELISVPLDGTSVDKPSDTPSISADGRFVSFSSLAPQLVEKDSNHAEDVFLRDRQAGTTVKITTQPAGVHQRVFGHFSMVSGDGRYVTFLSSAGSLVVGVQNGNNRVYVYTRSGD